GDAERAVIETDLGGRLTPVAPIHRGRVPVETFGSRRIGERGEHRVARVPSIHALDGETADCRDRLVGNLSGTLDNGYVRVLMFNDNRNAFGAFFVVKMGAAHGEDFIGQ